MIHLGIFYDSPQAEVLTEYKSKKKQIWYEYDRSGVISLAYKNQLLSST